MQVGRRIPPPPPSGTNWICLLVHAGEYSHSQAKPPVASLLMELRSERLVSGTELWSQPQATVHKSHTCSSGTLTSHGSKAELLFPSDGKLHQIGKNERGLRWTCIGAFEQIGRSPNGRNVGIRWSLRTLDQRLRRLQGKLAPFLHLYPPCFRGLCIFLTLLLQTGSLHVAVSGEGLAHAHSHDKVSSCSSCVGCPTSDHHRNPEKELWTIVVAPVPTSENE